MPYCPKCDMEFIDGITVCTDCGGPLMESKEAADAMRKEEEAKEQARRFEAMKEAGYTPDMFAPEETRKQATAPQAQSQVYVNKAQKYQDMKSSASAFYGVGAILTAASALLWTNVIHVPLTGTSRIMTFGIMTVMGIGSLAVALSTSRSAKTISAQVETEQEQTDRILKNFLQEHTAAALDKTLKEELEGLSPEEISLKRLELIQDLLITSNDISDQAYVDALADELYERLFE